MLTSVQSRALMHDRMLIQVRPQLPGLLKFLSMIPPYETNIELTTLVCLLGFGRTHHIQVSCLNMEITNFLVNSGQYAIYFMS